MGTLQRGTCLSNRRALFAGHAHSTVAPGMRVDRPIAARMRATHDVGFLHTVMRKERMSPASIARRHAPVMTRPVAIQTEHLDAEAAHWLGERCDLIVCAHDDTAFHAALANADALVVRTYTQVNEGLLARAPKLKVVGRAGVGLDNIDLLACRARNISVVYTPAANTQAVVEYVFALMLDDQRPRIAIDRAWPASQWNQLRHDTVGRRQLNELTLGILGLGRVGKGVAKVAGAVGCEVLYHDLLDVAVDQRQGGRPVGVDELFATSDVLSIHIDGRPTNLGFVGERLLSRMKPDALLINTSRGSVVDNLSLARRLRDHPQARAMLDVHEPEPFASDYPLLNLPNVRLYPHLASRTATAMANMSWVVRDVWAVLEGKPPRFPAPLKA